ncbi:hypothetical protein COT68_01430 [bacterium (Candidatus Torokbacteria) CG09_land_8_20_14_0_10_42_11]|nr:MAG: hypothetical protein COT68_01430 [bacterium (Candidatus Torokbacteria) CG09_land_8_20_14_0_10_42_11]
MPKIFSGKEVVKILCRDFRFHFVSQKGSHAKLVRKIDKRKIITIVPMHKELARGTFKGVLRLAQVEEEDFKKNIKTKS